MIKIKRSRLIHSARSICLAVALFASGANASYLSYNQCSGLFNAAATPYNRYIYEARRELLKELWPLNDEPSITQNIFTLTKLSPSPGQRIVLTGFHHNIGDNLLNFWNRIETLHRLFPASEIVVLSPIAEMLGKNLEQNPWLKPITVVSADDLNALNQLLFTDDFIVNIHWGSVTAVAEAKGIAGIHIYGDLQIRNSEMVSGNILLTIPLSNSAALESNRKFISKKSISPGAAAFAEIPLRGSQTLPSILPIAELDELYTLRQISNRILFGSDQASDIPASLFVDLSKAPQLSSNFLHQNFSDYGKSDRYIIINLNTLGDYKLAKIRKDYFARSRRLIEGALASDPNLKILVTAPEGQMQIGDAQMLKLMALMQSHAQRVTWMPQSKEIWLALISNAKYVVSQDSGFVHLALLVLPAQRVFAFGRQIAPDDNQYRVGSAFWRKPFQPYIEETPPKNQQQAIATDQVIIDWMRTQYSNP